MTRDLYSAQIKELEDELAVMVGLVTRAIRRSVQALRFHNTEEAASIIEDDTAIDRKRWEIEEACVRMIATQQPVATDLREFIAMLNIITELERIGDHAEGIAKIVQMIGDQEHIKPLIDIPRMAEKAVNMIQRSHRAFVDRDVEEAKRICHEDDDVDQLYDQIYRELLSFMVEDPHIITRATYLIWTAHNIERMADRATNICERIIYLVNGSFDEDTCSKY